MKLFYLVKRLGVFKRGRCSFSSHLSKLVKVFSGLENGELAGNCWEYRHSKMSQSFCALHSFPSSMEKECLGRRDITTQSWFKERRLIISLSQYHDVREDAKSKVVFIDQCLRSWSRQWKVHILQTWILNNQRLVQPTHMPLCHVNTPAFRSDFKVKGRIN